MDVMEKVSALTWLVLETPGINLCCDINGMFILGWALRVTGHKEKAKCNSLQGVERRGVKKHRGADEEGGGEMSIHNQEPRGAEIAMQ